MESQLIVFWCEEWIILFDWVRFWGKSGQLAVRGNYFWVSGQLEVGRFIFGLWGNWKLEVIHLIMKFIATLISQSCCYFLIWPKISHNIHVHIAYNLAYNATCGLYVAPQSFWLHQILMKELWNCLKISKHSQQYSYIGMQIFC